MKCELSPGLQVLLLLPVDKYILQSLLPSLSFFSFLFLFCVERTNAKWAWRLNCPFSYLIARNCALGLCTKYRILLFIYSQSQKMQLLLLLGQGREGKEYAGEEENL